MRTLWRSRLFIICTLCFFGMTAAFSVRSLALRPCCDAAGYLLLGSEVAAKGPIAKLGFSRVRTIGYPSFIAVVSNLPLPGGTAAKVIIVQAVLYWLTATALLRTARRRWPDQADRPWVVSGLLLNPLTASFCAETLTESLSLTAFLACTTAALAVTSHPLAIAKRYSAPFVLGLLAGLALIVRPANLALVSAVGFAVVLPPWFVPAAASQRLGKMVRSVVAASVGVYIGLSPQLAVNLKHFDKLTPFPTVELGNLQVHEGIRNLKYGTYVGPERRSIVIQYPNPFVKGTVVGSDNLRWYQRHPGRGVLTLAGHVFATLAQDPFYTYVTDIQPWYRLPVLLLNAVVVVLGLGFLVAWWWVHRTAALPSSAVWFVLSATGCSLAIGALSQAESRFGLLPLSVCFAATCAAVEHLARTHAKRPLLWAMGTAGAVVFVLLGLGLSRLSV